MLKPRVRARVLILLAAVAAVALGVIRWRRDRELRADLLRRADTCQEFASTLRTIPKHIPETWKVLDFHIDEKGFGYSSLKTSDPVGVTPLEAGKEFELRAVEYERLSLAYRRAASSPWVTSAPPIPHYKYRPTPRVPGTRPDQAGTKPGASSRE